MLETEAELTLETRGEEHRSSDQVARRGPQCVARLRWCRTSVGHLRAQVSDGSRTPYTRRVIVCGQCGRENPGDARFCNSCGAPLVAQQRMREERKVDGGLRRPRRLDRRAEQLDPEDVRRSALPRDAQAGARALRRNGGEVHRRRGGRRVRRADRGGRSRARRPPPVAVRSRRSTTATTRSTSTLRVGGSGEALVALDAAAAAGESMVAGDVMNTAARIQAAAPGRRDSRERRDPPRAERLIVSASGTRPIAAKGKAEPVEVWEAVEAVGRVGEARRPAVHSARRARHERALLLGPSRGFIDRSPQLVTLVGVPGSARAGSSELGEAVAEERRDHRLALRCLPYGTA